MGFESLKNRWVEKRNYVKSTANTICGFETASPGLPVRVTSVPDRKAAPCSPKGLRKK